MQLVFPSLRILSDTCGMLLSLGFGDVKCLPSWVNVHCHLKGFFGAEKMFSEMSLRARARACVCVCVCVCARACGCVNERLERECVTEHVRERKLRKELWYFAPSQP